MSSFFTRRKRPFAPRRRLFGIALGATLASTGAFLTATAVAAPADQPDPGVYAFDIQLASVCLDGQFPLSVDSPSGVLNGTLSVTTGATGKLSGSVTLGAVDFTVKGKVKHRADGSKLTLSLREGRKNRITLKGDLVAGEFSGKSAARGDAAKGKGAFTLDVSAAAPQMATIITTLAPKKKTLQGDGTVSVCGPALDVKVKGGGKKKFRLVVKGKGFRFTGIGDPADGSQLTFSAKGYGAVVKVDETAPPLVLDPLDAPAFTDPNGYASRTVLYETENPIAPNAALGSFDRATFTVAPALPDGIVMDPLTGEISGLPTTVTPSQVHTVTVANPAGQDTETVTVTIRINRALSLAAESRALNDEDYRHFLTRTHFGVEDSHLASIQGQSLANFIDGMMTFQQGTAAEAAAFQELVGPNDPAGLEGKFPSRTDCARYWTTLMVETDNPFQESLALFWHDHFGINTDVLGGSNLFYMVDHIDLLRAEGAGNLKDLILSISRDPAMLIFLDGFRNRDGAPNENYARELWELFTLGVDAGYTQDDIVESARALTGYRQRYDSVTALSYMEFDTGRHDGDDKIVIGQTITGQDVTDDFDAVVDITFNQGAPEQYVCRKLLEWFVYPDPPQAVVDQLGAQLRNNGWELGPVLKTMLLSEAFFSPRAQGSLVKSPVDFGVGFIRATGLKIRTSDLDNRLNTLGQRLTRPPTVDGWPAGLLWLSSQALVDRTNLAHLITRDINRQQNTFGVDVDDILPANPTADNVVDSFADRLRVDLLPDDRQEIIDYMNTVRQNDGTVVDSPFDATNQSHLNERARGALYILSQHPTYHIR